MRRKRAHPILNACLAALASACVSVQPPPCSAKSEWGVAHAPTPEAAERLSQHVSRLAPRILAAVPGLSNGPVDARFVDGMHLDGMSAGIALSVKGTTIEKNHVRWIEIPEGSDPAEEEHTLAHELVHFWIGPDWDPLPYFLEEGLADNVQDSLVFAGYARESRERALILSSAAFGGLILSADGVPLRCGSGAELKDPKESLEVVLFSTDRGALPTPRETLALRDDALKTVRDPEKYVVMFCYGYLLVARIGVERLHGLCLRARAAGLDIVPADWVFESAGLPIDDREAWNRAILELVAGS